MPSTFATAKFAKLTSNGGAKGLLTIADNTGWLPGATINLISDTVGGVELTIVKQVGTTQILCRPKISSFAKLSYQQGVDLSAYTTVDNASVNMEGQVVPVQAPFTPTQDVP